MFDPNAETAAATATPPEGISAAPEGVRFDVALERYHTLALAARVWAFAEAESVGQLTGLIDWARASDKPWRILGGGTNVMPARDFLDMLIIRLGRRFADIEVDGGRGVVTCGAAAMWRPVIKAARDAGFGGLEYGWCIPGTIGGALAGNAGAAGRAVCEDVVRVHILDPETLSARTIDGGDVDYSYRNSSLRNAIILGADLRVVAMPADVIDERLGRMRAMRESQPSGVKSSGCIFRNPECGSAGRVIDELGLKGFAVGDAAVSEVHGNFLINTGRATPRDMLALITEVQRRVADDRGIALEPEVRFLGVPDSSPVSASR
jgi:UDP-N-acetylmuramate dehydrogenase